MKKLIKVVSRGMVNTSRGPMITPNTRPFLEDVDSIFRMIAKGAKIIEVLPNKTEVELNERNFNTDNRVKEKPVKVEVKIQEPITDKTPIVPTMTRQERKRAEYEKKLAAQKAREKVNTQAQTITETKQEEVTPIESTDTTVECAIEE